MAKSRLFERTRSTRWIYKGRIVSLKEDTVRLPDGNTSKREVVLHPGAVAVIAILPSDRIVLVRQFRKATEQELLEIPAGLAHKGESFPAAARRELEEEAGYLAKNVKPVFTGFTSPGYSSEVIRFFLATGLKKTKAGGDRDEFIDVEVMPISRAIKLASSGKIRDNKTMIGILLAEKWKNK